MFEAFSGSNCGRHSFFLEEKESTLWTVKLKDRVFGVDQFDVKLFECEKFQHLRLRYIFFFGRGPLCFLFCSCLEGNNLGPFTTSFQGTLNLRPLVDSHRNMKPLVFLGEIWKGKSGPSLCSNPIILLFFSTLNKPGGGFKYFSYSPLTWGNDPI